MMKTPPVYLLTTLPVPDTMVQRSGEGGPGVDRDFVSALDLEELTGTKASTWRYWASIGTGPASFRLGRRRVWRRSVVMKWLEEQETATARGDVH